LKPESPFYARCLKVLRDAILFSGLDDPTLAEMLGTYRRETWPKGALLPPDQVRDRFTVVISGRVELTRANPETGRQITLFLAEPGDAFDVITLLDNKEHDVYPIAMDAVDVITAPLQATRRWLQAHPAFNRAFLPYLAKRIRELENLSADLALTETVTRLARLILLQAVPGLEESDPEIEAPAKVTALTNEAMARMIGSVRTVVNRHLQDFKDKGLISTSPGKLIVNDLERLREHCERLL
jgi:CRP-like cAMP-binding protein